MGGGGSSDQGRGQDTQNDADETKDGNARTYQKGLTPACIEIECRFRHPIADKTENKTQDDPLSGDKRLPEVLNLQN